MTQATSAALWSERNAATAAAFGRHVNPSVRMAFEWNWGDPLPAGLVFTGDANRTKIDANGIVRTVAANVPRNDGYVYDKNGVLQGAWLLEGAATNGIRYSEQFDNAAWNALNTSVTPNAATAPDGNATADLIADTSAVALGEHYQECSIPNDSGPVTFSVWLNKATSSVAAIGLDLHGGTAVSTIVVVDLNAGTLLNASVFVTTAPTRARIIAFPNGWYRVSVTLTNNASGNTLAQAQVFPAWASTQQSTDDQTVTGGVYAWGAQLESSPVETSYIPTTSAAVMRAAETAYVPWAFKPQLLTMYAKFVECGTILTSIGGILDITNNPLFALFSNTFYEIQMTNGSVAASRLAAATSLGDTGELRGVQFGDGSVQLGQSLNGAVEAVTARSIAVALPSMWPVPRLYLNGDGAITNRGFTAFQSIRVALNGSWTLRQMQKLDVDPSRIAVADAGTPIASLVRSGGKYIVTPDDLSGDGRIVYVDKDSDSPKVVAY